MIGLEMLKLLQVNLQHSKAASASLCKNFIDQKIDIALIQEPYILFNRVVGLKSIREQIIHSHQHGVRTCILAKNDIQLLMLSNFCSRDLTAVKLTLQMDNTTTEVIIASVYMPFDSPDPPQTNELMNLVDYCKLKKLQLIIGADANSHHEVWGSTNTNPRGESLLNYLAAAELEILNIGNKPTFVTKGRREVLDITMASIPVCYQISGWHVSDEPSLSDHRYILMEVDSISKPTRMYRNPRKTDWEGYRKDLTRNLTNTLKPICCTYDIEAASDLIQEAITTLYQENCKLISQSANRKTVWWTRTLENLKRETRRLFNRAKKTGEWDEYRSTLGEYTRAIKKAKADSWRSFCGDIESSSETARIHRLLAKNPVNPTGTILKPDGEYTNTEKDTLEVLLQTHFPGSNLISDEDVLSSHSLTVPEKAGREDWRISKEVITVNKIKWAINLFEPYKSPGPDGIFLALLQQGFDILSPHLCRLFRASVATGYIPNNWKKVKVVFIPKPG